MFTAIYEKGKVRAHGTGQLNPTCLMHMWPKQCSEYQTAEKKSNPPTRHGGAWGERRYTSYSFSTSELDGGEWSASRPSRTLPWGKDAGTHCTGGWEGLRASLDTEDRGKILCPCRGSNPDRPVVQSVVRHYTDWATPAPRQLKMKVNLFFSELKVLSHIFMCIHILLNKYS
jgi:hypothetical protein